MVSGVKLLSLCIPTNGSSDFVLPVLDSIYSQGINDSIFEVVITDNGKESTLEASIQNYKQIHGNLYYYKSDMTGFVNQVDAFKRSNGLYIKMLNHRAVLLPGTLSDMISLVEKYKDSQPVIYWSNGVLSIEDIIETNDFDGFVKTLSYYSSWSAGVGIWNVDKPSLEMIKYSDLFPHASILFESRTESRYVIWNKKYMVMEDDKAKGGYNLFYAFAVVYLDLLKDLEQRNRIKLSTFKSVKRDLSYFLDNWYYILNSSENQYTFSIDECRKHILKYYSWMDYIIIKFRRRLSICIRKMISIK